MKSCTLSIRHQTTYKYIKPVRYTIQQLRLRPRKEDLQRTLNWEVSSAGKRQEHKDCYGNISEILTITHPHKEVSIVSSGVIKIKSPVNGRLPEKNVLSPLIFTVPTEFTMFSDDIKKFANDFLSKNANTKQLLKLSEAICKNIVYQPGSTVTSSTAQEAFFLERGVCQDHAHIFIACCHSFGIPVRYVSGYVDPGNVDYGASHAWVDVWANDTDFSGWVSIDVTHASYQNSGYCRLAVGRDYASAGPIRGVRDGGGEESLSVNVDIENV
tara:strand:+ start:2406 stop:3215 length:810 start_codon:yes stop_codon:yes gene_type:complete